MLSDVTATILVELQEMAGEKEWDADEAKLLWGGDTPSTFADLDDLQKLQLALSMTIDDLVRTVREYRALEQVANEQERKLRLYGNRATRRTK